MQRPSPRMPQIYDLEKTTEIQKEAEKTFRLHMIKKVPINASKSQNLNLEYKHTA